jgi:predicted nucleotidyltransferase
MHRKKAMSTCWCARLPGTSLLDLGGLLMEAQSLLGRRDEIVSEQALHPALREKVLREAQPL